MSIHLQRQFDRLKKTILLLGTMVEESVERAIRAAEQRDPELAEKVITDDQRIDLMEIDVEEECLHTLALHQPVAFDLRFVVATLKINNDLERIADLAVNVAEQAKFLSEEDAAAEAPFDLRGMGRIVRTMLKQSLDALVNVDPKLAEQVRQTDDQVDEIHRAMYERIETLIRENPHQIQQMIHYLNISRQLERMGDHCVNIAEDVLYMARGDIARHSHTPPANV
ncbi:MAG: phosphate signaling complex protein PhoU [Phycisphaeraceae bacterium]